LYIQADRIHANIIIHVKYNLS